MWLAEAFNLARDAQNLSSDEKISIVGTVNFRINAS